MYIEMLDYLSKYTEVLYEEESILNFTINPRFFLKMELTSTLFMVVATFVVC